MALLQVGELLKKEDYEGAAQTSKAAIATAADADVKRQLVWRFCSAMQQLNREMAAYEELSRSDEAFRTLAGGLVGEEHFDRLRKNPKRPSGPPLTSLIPPTKNSLNGTR